MAAGMMRSVRLSAPLRRAHGSRPSCGLPRRHLGGPPPCRMSWMSMETHSTIAVGSSLTDGPHLVRGWGWTREWPCHSLDSSQLSEISDMKL